MKLTAFTDYSLRVLLYLAARPERRATIAEIAASYRVSEHHLTKVVHFLGRNGWLASVRGKGGGLALGKPPGDITVGSVVRQTEGQAIAECFGEAGGKCSIAPVCRLRGVLGEALEAFYAVLDRHTLVTLAGNREQLAPILFMDLATA
jgi:Rrf2 family nitric oxide-sensitive transcriptional repressor